MAVFDSEVHVLGFWTRSSIGKQEVPIIGFCFSFPVEQTSVDSGKLLRWTKGYTNPGAVGNDPAKLLSDAFKRRVSLDQLPDMMWFPSACGFPLVTDRFNALEKVTTNGKETKTTATANP